MFYEISARDYIEHNETPDQAVGAWVVRAPQATPLTLTA